MVNPNRFYTYAYLRKDRTPYYIGKGNGNRTHRRGTIQIPQDEKNILILKRNLTEEKAYNHKVYMISILGRKDLGTGILENGTNGYYGNKKQPIKNKKIKKIKNLINYRFGKLLVIDEVERKRKPCGKPVRVFLCKCDCGTEKTIRMSDLTTGKTISCGCLVKKHGKRNSRAYVIWKGMKARCLNPKSTSYKNYGGSGVTIDERWLDFKNFYEDMGDPPDGMTLDKDSVIEGNKVYGPGLCKWSTPAEQSLSRRCSVNKKSKYVYVSWNKITNKWRVNLHSNNKLKNFGTFDSEEDAALFVCNHLKVTLNEILRENWISSTYHFENCHKAD